MPSDFNVDNLAYQRFLAVATDHFEVSQWIRDRDDQPVMVTLVDLPSGDAFSIALIDSVEVSAGPHVLAAFDTENRLAAYGPFDGRTAAAAQAAPVAAADDAVAATRPLPLHGPESTERPDDWWIGMPPEIAASAYPADVDAVASIVVLVDRSLHRCCAVGPFPTDAAAADWPLPLGVDPQVARLVVALHEVGSAT